MATHRILLNALSLTIGGGRSYVRNLLRELNEDSRGFEFQLLCVAGQVTPEEVGDLQVEELRFPGNRMEASVVSRVLYEQTLLPLRKSSCDLIYCLADLAPVVSRVPVVAALRNPNIYDRTYYDNFRLRSMNALVRCALPRLSGVVFPSRAAADLVRRFVSIPEERVTVVHHGISVDSFEMGRFHDEPRVPYVFLPAALERHKNIEGLIEALEKVSNRELEVWIAGGNTTDPRYGEELIGLARSLGLEERVRFLGPVPYAEVLRYYRGAQALVFPSWLETFGHPLLEAMIAEIPIIASDIPSSREIAGSAALYFPPEDPAALALLIDRVVSDPASCRERLRTGTARVSEFSWKKSVDRLCEVFDGVLGASL
ncbi:glycosyltransferase family 4 protein [Myxococcota bacterium]|nr:glycosyltransferase family 4 protein [Myxococcota bacterium]